MPTNRVTRQAPRPTAPTRPVRPAATLSSHTGCSAAWLARRVWVAEAAGSNPASPTNACTTIDGQTSTTQHRPPPLEQHPSPWTSEKPGDLDRHSLFNCSKVEVPSNC